MKEKHIKLVGGFRHKIDKGGRLTSHHAKLLLGIAETWGAENVSLGNRLVMATSAANVATEELSKSRKSCDALRRRARMFLNGQPQNQKKQNGSKRGRLIAAAQGNRNPFIDHPEWVAILFDSKRGGKKLEKTNEELIAIFHGNLAKGGRLSPNCGSILLRIVGEQSGRIDALQAQLDKATEDGCCSAESAKDEMASLSEKLAVAVADVATRSTEVALAVGKIEVVERQLEEAVASSSPAEPE